MTENKNAAGVKRYDTRFKESGGRIISRIRLKPDAAEALEVLEQQSKDSPTAIINQLLIDAASNTK